MALKGTKIKSAWANLSAANKILLILFIFSIFFRVFSIMVVPEPAYNDSVYHLELAKQFIDGAQVTKEMPPFLYHLLLSAFFGATGFPMVWPFVKVIPLLVTFAQIALAFFLLRSAFPKNYLFPLIFFVSFPWMVRIGSVNMVDSFSVLAVTFFVFCLFKLAFGVEKKFLFAALGVLSFFFMAFSKMNVVFILPFLLAGFFFVLVKKVGLPKAILFGVVAALLSVSFIFISINAPPSANTALEGDVSSIRGLPPPQLNLINPQFFPVSYATFFDFPNYSAFAKFPLLNTIPYAAALWIFIIILLPLAGLILLGTKKSLVDFCEGLVPSKIRSISSEKIFWITCALGFLVSLYPALTIIRQDSLYIRYLLPALPFIALLVGLAFENCSARVKKIALVSLLLFAIFSFASTSTSALFYQGVEKQNTPLYDFINASSDFNAVISMQNARALEYYTNKSTIQLSLGAHTLSEVLSEYGGVTRYIALSCYNEDLLTSVPEVNDLNKVAVIFESGCTKLVKII